MNALRNVVHLAIGFLCIFLSFNSQGFILQTVIDSAAAGGTIPQKAGYYSLAIIYAFCMVANLFVAPVVDFLGSRWSMTLGSLAFTIFLIGMLFLNAPYLFISSAIVGIGSALIWTGQGKYLAMNSTKSTASRNSGILWGLLQASLLGGGLFLFGIFTWNESDHISTKVRRIIYGGFTVISIIGNVILVTIPTRGLCEKRQQTDENTSTSKILLSAFHLVLTRDMALLVISFIYSGLELSYFTGIYSTVISFTKKLNYNTHKLVALNAICQGLGEIIGGFLFGIMGDKFRRFGRTPIILIGFVVHIACFILSYLFFPAEASLRITNDNAIIEPSIPIALVLGGLLGFGDACWNTQIYSILIDVYSTKSAQAFSILKFFQAASACASFFYSAALDLQWIIIILIVFCILATLTFIIVERNNKVHVQRNQPTVVWVGETSNS